MMTLTLELPENIIKAMEQRAVSAGKPVSQYAAEVLEREVSNPALRAMQHLWERSDREGWKSHESKIMPSDDEMYLR